MTNTEMKKWKEAGICVLSFSDTENGGKPSDDFDQQWFDQNEALHVNFVIAENNGGGGGAGGAGGGAGGLGDDDLYS